MTIDLARTPPRNHFTVDGGSWWTEYRVRQLTDAERNTEQTYRFRYVLEARYCHDVAAGCTAHDGIWRAYEYGYEPVDAVRAFVGDDAFRKAESLDPLHAECVAVKNRARRIARAADVLHHATHYTCRMLGVESTTELDVEADEREQAEARYEARLRSARLHKAASLGLAPKDKIDTIKAEIRAEYERRVTERRRRHAAMLAKYRELTTRQ